MVPNTVFVSYLMCINGHSLETKEKSQRNFSTEQPEKCLSINSSEQKLEINLLSKLLIRNTIMEIYMEKKLTQTFHRKRNVGFSYFDS